MYKGCPNGVMANVLNCEIVVIKFGLQFHYSGINLSEKYERLYSTSYRFNSTSTVHRQRLLSHWITNESWYVIKQKHQIKPNQITYIHIYVWTLEVC